MDAVSAMVAGNDREVGELLGRMTAVERTTERLERKLDANSSSTEEILKRIAALDGGWKVLLAISGLVSAGMALAIKFLPIILGHG